MIKKMIVLFLISFMITLSVFCQVKGEKVNIGEKRFVHSKAYVRSVAPRILLLPVESIPAHGFDAE